MSEIWSNTDFPYMCLKDETRTLVAGEIEVELDPDATVNAVRLAGRIGLSTNRTLGPSHALNGDKILPVQEFSGRSRAALRWRHRMGGGLGALELDCDPFADVKRRAA